MRAMMMALAAATMLAGTASANEGNGYTRIAAGDFAGAERELLDQRRVFPDAPDLMLNLAALYARAGRAADARDLYRRVTAVPAESMRLPDGRSASSHDLAAAGLQKVAGAQIAGR